MLTKIIQAGKKKKKPDGTLDQQEEINNIRIYIYKYKNIFKSTLFLNVFQI